MNDSLLKTIREGFEEGLTSQKIYDKPGVEFSNIDCLMVGLAFFTFKSSSLLKFDEA